MQNYCRFLGREYKSIIVWLNIHDTGKNRLNAVCTAMKSSFFHHQRQRPEQYITESIPNLIRCNIIDLYPTRLTQDIHVKQLTVPKVITLVIDKWLIAGTQPLCNRLSFVLIIKFLVVSLSYCAASMASVTFASCSLKGRQGGIVPDSYSCGGNGQFLLAEFS